jgi:hypothetical protein
MEIKCQAFLLSLHSVDEWSASRSVYLISVELSSAIQCSIGYMGLIFAYACVCIHA